MNISLKHTNNVVREYFSPKYGTDRIAKGYCARHFNTDRIAQEMELTDEQVQYLESLVLIKEGVDDYWTAYTKKGWNEPVGKRSGKYNPDNRIVCDETFAACAQDVIDCL